MNVAIALILHATAFAADKHRSQRRKDAEASPYINHPVALANLLAQAGICDTTVLAAACNLRDVCQSPPQDWSIERKREYFDWARQVVGGLRGTHARLEELFDIEYAKRP